MEAPDTFSCLLYILVNGSLLGEAVAPIIFASLINWCRSFRRRQLGPFLERDSSRKFKHVLLYKNDGKMLAVYPYTLVHSTWR